MDFPEKRLPVSFFCCTPKLQLTRYNKDGMSITAPSVIIAVIRQNGYLMMTGVL